MMNDEKNDGKPAGATALMMKTTLPAKIKTAADVMTIFEAYRPMIQRALPAHLTPERMIQWATTLVAASPKLKECTPASLIGAMMQSSILESTMALSGMVSPRPS